MATKVHGLVLRSKDRVRLQQFYSALGLNFNEHEHGGPIHAEHKEEDGDFVFEIYTASKRFPYDALVLIVDSLADALKIVLAEGGPILCLPKVQNSIRFAYVADPDNRPVMLVEYVK